MTDALRDAGYVVEHAGDGEEALLKVEAQAFDAVVCDLRMPRLDGKAFYHALSRSAPGLAKRVVFVTGDVAGTEAGDVSRTERLPLARQAVQARRSAAER